MGNRVWVCNGNRKRLGKYTGIRLLGGVGARTVTSGAEQAVKAGSAVRGKQGACAAARAGADLVQKTAWLSPACPS